MKCRRGLAMRILFVGPSVCPSVGLSLKRVHCDKTEEKSVQIFIPCERSFSLVFCEDTWLLGATWNFGSTGLRWSKIADCQPIFDRSSSAVTPSEKVQLKLIIPMSLRWSSYVASKSPKGGSKTQNGRFPSKIALRLKKVCYKVSLFENCQRQSCKACIGLTIHAKMIGGATLTTWNFGSSWPHWSEITDCRSFFRP